MLTWTYSILQRANNKSSVVKSESKDWYFIFAFSLGYGPLLSFKISILCLLEHEYVYFSFNLVTLKHQYVLNSRCVTLLYILDQFLCFTSPHTTLYIPGPSHLFLVSRIFYVRLEMEIPSPPNKNQKLYK